MVRYSSEICRALLGLCINCSRERKKKSCASLVCVCWFCFIWFWGFFCLFAFSSVEFQSQLLCWIALYYTLGGSVYFILKIISAFWAGVSYLQGKLLCLHDPRCPTKNQRTSIFWMWFLLAAGGWAELNSRVVRMACVVPRGKLRCFSPSWQLGRQELNSEMCRLFPKCPCGVWIWW